MSKLTSVALWLAAAAVGVFTTLFFIEVVAPLVERMP